jgi:hypothetical protein
MLPHDLLWYIAMGGAFRQYREVVRIDAETGVESRKWVEDEYYFPPQDRLAAARAAAPYYAPKLATHIVSVQSDPEEVGNLFKTLAESLPV